MGCNTGAGPSAGADCDSALVDPDIYPADSIRNVFPRIQLFEQGLKEGHTEHKHTPCLNEGKSWEKLVLEDCSQLLCSWNKS